MIATDLTDPLHGRRAGRGWEHFGLLLSAMLVACGAAVERFTDCADAPCRQAWVIARLGSDTRSALDAVLATEDPTERALLVGVVVDRHPEMSQSLCGRLTAGPDRDVACATAERPHVWTPLPGVQPSRLRAGGGPPGTTLVPSADLGSRGFPATPAGPDPCAGRPDRATCLTAEAMRAAGGADPGRAAGLCATLEEERWRAECHFRAAEVASEGRPPLEYADAVHLCALAGRFAPQCYAHLAIGHATGAPRADTPDPEAWRGQIDAARQLDELWGGLDPAFGRLQVDLFWSRSLDYAYSIAPSVTGDPLAALPPETVPHVRAAAAARLLETEVTAGRSLAGWARALATALERRGGAPKGPQNAHRHDARKDLWPADGPGEDAVPAVYYRGVSRRTVARNPTSDLAICVLEAAARLAAPDVGLLAEGRDHPDPLVRWTAERLGLALGPATTPPGPAPGRPALRPERSSASP